MNDKVKRTTIEEECYKSNRRILEGRSKEYKEEIHHALGDTLLKSSEIAKWLKLSPLETSVKPQVLTLVGPGLQ